MKTLEIKPGMLTLDTIRKLSSAKTKLSLNIDSKVKIQRSHDTVTRLIAENRIMYGVNTGFGSLANQIISSDKLAQLQKNIVLSHACGSGELLSDDTVALILLLKINALSQGFSGVSLSLIERLIDCHNFGIYACIPGKGSVGASGDLAPLAHLAMTLIGEGDVRYKNKLLPAATCLKAHDLAPITLGPKEGLAMLNGLQLSQALLLQAFFVTERLFEIALIAGALTTDAAKGSDAPFDARIHAIRGHRAQQDVAEMLKALLQGSDIRSSHQDCDRVQDPYCLRCQPQILGAVLQQIRNVGDILSAEINSVTDNPLVFSDEGDILSGGNFHGEMLAMGADNLALAIAEMGALSERRIALLVDSNFSGLPPFLVKESGINSGFMVAHVTAAALASENKALAHPHSVDSIPTSANQEDHVSMATNAARRLHQMNDNVATILAIELLAACQGLEFHHPLKTSPRLQGFYEKIRLGVDPYNQDRYFAPDIEYVKAAVLSGNLLNP